MACTHGGAPSHPDGDPLGRSQGHGSQVCRHQALSKGRERALGTQRDIPDPGQITGPGLIAQSAFQVRALGGLVYPPKQVGVDLKGWRWCTTLFSLYRHVSALVRQVETFLSAWAQRGVRPTQPPSLPSCASQRRCAGPLGFRATKARPHQRHGGALNHPPTHPHHPPAATCTWSRSTLPWTHGTPSPRAESCMPGAP